MVKFRILGHRKSCKRYNTLVVGIDQGPGVFLGVTYNSQVKGKGVEGSRTVGDCTKDRPF